MNRIRVGMAALVAGTGVAAAAPAEAVVTTFATYLPTNSSTANMRYAQTGTDDGNLYTIATPNAKVPGSVATRFTFVNSALSALGIVNASYTFYSTVADNTAASIDGFLIQNIDDGSFSFTYSGVTPLVVGTKTYTTGANLLTGTFIDANIFGTVQGSAGSVDGSQPSGTVSYTSDFMTFTPAEAKDFSLALTSITPLLHRVNANSSVATFKANSTGAFSADVAALPEPAVWGMLVMGFSLAGFQIRRKASTYILQ